MARLGETSVVIAIRDWQWMNRTAKDQFPDTYLALSGNAETRLGDAAIKQGERLFLFEIKSTRQQIKDEWKERQSKDGSLPDDGAVAAKTQSAIPPRPHLKAADGTKLAFNYAKQLVLDCVPFAGDESRWPTLVASSQAHHFVYWLGERIQGSASPGHLVIEPYIAGIVSTNPDLNLHAAQLSSRLKMALSYPPLPEDAQDSIRFIKRPALLLDSLNGQRGRIIESLHGKHYWNHLGLELPEFQLYVMDLCGNSDNDEEINVVVLSSQGSYMAHLTKISELKTIFEPNEPDSIRLQGHEKIRQMEIAQAGAHPSVKPDLGTSSLKY